MPNTLDVVVVGHSFVRRLGQLCAASPPWDNLGLKRESHAVGFHGRTAAGKNISTILDVAGEVSAVCQGRKPPTVLF